MTKKFFALARILSFVLLTSCVQKKKPNMSYDQKDKGVVQEIDMVSIPASAKNFDRNAKNSQKKLEILRKEAKSRNKTQEEFL